MSNRTALATIPTAPLPATLLEEIEAAHGFADAARAPNTVRTYAAAWQVFADWCTERSLSPLPAEPSVVATFLAARATAGAKESTVRLGLTAIIAQHRTAGLPFDQKHRNLVAVVAGIRRTLGTAPEKKAPVLVDDLRAMLATLDRETIAGKRDAALRRSEIVGLTVADIRIDRKGLVVTLRRSKTDQEGAGQDVAVHRGRDADLCPVVAVQEWIAAAGLTEGPLFRRVRKNGLVGTEPLSDRAVALIVKDCAAAAGLDPERYSGHSLRAGLATSAALAGASLEQVMRQTRHKSITEARGYVRVADQWRDNVTAKLF